MNQYYEPDITATGQLLGDLSRKLTAMGVLMTVVAAPPTYTEAEIAFERVEDRANLRIYRIGPERFKGRKTLRTRLAGYFGYLWSALFIAIKLTKDDKYDIIMTCSNPPFIALLGAWLANKRKIPYIYILHDIHPDLLIKTSKFRLPAFFILLWNSMNRYIFKVANTIIVLGPDMREILHRLKGVSNDKIREIHNWAHPERQPMDRHKSSRTKLGISDDTLLVMYSGNMGISHNLDWIVFAAKSLVHKPIHFLLVGQGEKKTELEAMVSNEKLTNVTFLPFQSESVYTELMAASDIGIVAMEPGLEGLFVPSKTYTILSAGRAVLAIMKRDSDIGRIITEHQCGWIAESQEDTVNILQNVINDPSSIRQTGINSRTLYENYFSLDRAAGEYLNLLKDVARN